MYANRRDYCHSLLIHNRRTTLHLVNLNLCKQSKNFIQLFLIFIVINFKVNEAYKFLDIKLVNTIQEKIRIKFIIVYVLSYPVSLRIS